MTKEQAILKAGGVARLAAIFECTSSAISQWKGAALPKSREYELRVKRPDWFLAVKAQPSAPDEAVAA